LNCGIRIYYYYYYHHHHNYYYYYFRRQKCDKEAKKILKYQDLTIEIQHMWNVKTNVISVIIGATGTISKSYRKYLSNIT
jgi:hypothetical protein